MLGYSPTQSLYSSIPFQCKTRRVRRDDRCEVVVQFIDWVGAMDPQTGGESPYESCKADVHCGQREPSEVSLNQSRSRALASKPRLVEA